MKEQLEKFMHGRWGIAIKIAGLAALWFAIGPIVAQLLLILIAIAGIILPGPIIQNSGMEHGFVMATPFLLMTFYFMQQWKFDKAAYAFVSFLGMMRAAYILYEGTTYAI